MTICQFVSISNQTTILPKNTFHVILIPDEDQEKEDIPLGSQYVSCVEFEYDEDQSKYFGVVASVFLSHLVFRYFHLCCKQSLL